MKIEKINDMRHFYSTKKHELKLNDIYKIHTNGNVLLLMFMNHNNDFAVVFPYRDGIENYLCDITWTLSNYDKSKVVVSNSDIQVFLSEILSRFEINSDSVYYFYLAIDNNKIYVNNLDSNDSVLLIEDYKKSSYYKQIIISIINCINKLTA